MRENKTKKSYLAKRLVRVEKHASKQLDFLVNRTKKDIANDYKTRDAGILCRQANVRDSSKNKQITINKF